MGYANVLLKKFKNLVNKSETYQLKEEINSYDIKNNNDTKQPNDLISFEDIMELQKEFNAIPAIQQHRKICGDIEELCNLLSCLSHAGSLIRLESFLHGQINTSIDLEKEFKELVFEGDLEPEEYAKLVARKLRTLDFAEEHKRNDMRDTFDKLKHMNYTVIKSQLEILRKKKQSEINYVFHIQD